MSREVNNRRRLTGYVVGDKMDKTIKVVVTTTQRHPLYQKVVRSAKNYLVHDENEVAKVGDKVRIVESRPLSRHKRFALEAVLTLDESGSMTDAVGVEETAS